MKMVEEFSKPHMQRFVRFALLALAVLVLNTTVGMCVQKPMPWVAMIPWLIPILVVPVVIMPTSNRRKS